MVKEGKEELFSSGYFQRMGYTGHLALCLVKQAIKPITKEPYNTEKVAEL